MKFETETHSAYLDIDAATPEEALEKAQAISTDELSWEVFEIGDINFIEITEDKGDGFAMWRSDELTLCLAAPDLLEALEVLGAAIEEGDPQTIADRWCGQCRRAIDRAKGRG
jgi:hypothetical protein